MKGMPMRRQERAVSDQALICQMLDMISIVNVAMSDGDCPYVVPLNFGYAAEADSLLVFLHSGRQGHKVDLWRQNPKVALAFSTFYNHPDRHYRHTIHDYRSVLAAGVISRIDPQTDGRRFGQAFQALLKHNGRAGNDFNPDHFRQMDLYMVRCRWEDVSGKAESPVRQPADVPFPDVYSLPFDDSRYDYSKTPKK